MSGHAALIAFAVGVAVFGGIQLWVRCGLRTQKKIRDAVPPEHWQGSGSDKRFDPTFGEAHAYAQGLIDAIREVEYVRHLQWSESIARRRLDDARKAIHRRAMVIKRRYG